VKTGRGADSWQPDRRATRPRRSHHAGGRHRRDAAERV